MKTYEEREHQKKLIGQIRAQLLPAVSNSIPNDFFQQCFDDRRINLRSTSKKDYLRKLRESQIMKENDILVNKCSKIKAHYRNSSKMSASDMSRSQLNQQNTSFYRKGSLNSKKMVETYQRIAAENLEFVKRLKAQKSVYKLNNPTMGGFFPKRRISRILTEGGQANYSSSRSTQKLKPVLSSHNLEVIPLVPDDYATRNVIYRERGYILGQTREVELEISLTQTFCYVILDVLAEGQIYKLRLVIDTGIHLLQLIESLPPGAILRDNWIVRERVSSGVYDLNGVCRYNNTSGLQARKINNYCLIIPFSPFVRKFRFKAVHQNQAEIDQATGEVRPTIFKIGKLALKKKYQSWRSRQRLTQTSKNDTGNKTGEESKYLQNQDRTRMETQGQQSPSGFGRQAEDYLYERYVTAQTSSQGEQMQDSVLSSLQEQPEEGGSSEISRWA